MQSWFPGWLVAALVGSLAGVYPAIRVVSAIHSSIQAIGLAITAIHKKPEAET